QVWPSQFGCDSTVVSTTVFDPQLRDTTAIQQMTCDPALAGVAVAVLTGADGCDSVLVTTTVLQPSPVVFIEKTTCNPALAGIVTQVWPSQFGCDSTVLSTTVFDPQLRDTTAIQQMTCDPALAGVAVAVLTGADGCDSVLVTTTVLQPSLVVFIEKTTCDPALAGIVTQVWPSQFGCDSTVVTTTILLPGDTTFQYQTTCDPAAAGVTVQVLQNLAGCDSMVVRTVLFDPAGCDTLLVRAESIGVSCSGQDDGQLLLTALSGIPPFQYTWTHLGGGATGTGLIQTLQQTETIGGLPGGVYQVVITTTATIVNDTTAVLIVEVPLALTVTAAAASGYHGYAISCAGAADGSAEVLAAGGTLPLQYAWSNGAQQLVASGLPEGWQHVTVTDSRGCVQSSAVYLAAPPPVAFGLQAIDESCAGKLDGRLDVIQVSGGVAPIQFALDGGAFSAQAHWQGLEPGTYAVQARDGNGCESADVFLDVQAGAAFSLDAGLDTVVFSGDTLLLTLSASQPVETVVWSPAQSVFPLSPAQVLVFPSFSTLYQVIATDARGCVASDQLRVEVTRKRNMYVPNAIYVDGRGGENSVFTVYGDQGVERVEVLRVYDRWGTLVFEALDVPPNIPAYGWQGDYRQGTVAGHVGVYVYYAVVRLSDESRVLLSGDVTVFR
ncbi:MAG: gliding motility-associated C-terminal domain-containing protein, partial [Saprospiraceae bacterium]|nr:gliding motility-associated C-terminal domain-containing protein [Saprospiraceae bacterium]